MRDWRYRRSGIFGRNDNQLGGVPVALTLQQLSSNFPYHLLMYSTALKFYPVNADIDECESDFIGIFSNTSFRESPPLQVLFGEAKTHHPFDANDARNLGMLADAIPPYVAEAFIMFSKTYFFTPEEITVARELNRDSRRVILWSRDQLEGKYAYARASDKLGQLPHMAISLKEMADYTDTLFFARVEVTERGCGLELGARRCRATRYVPPDSSQFMSFVLYLDARF